MPRSLSFNAAASATFELQVMNHKCPPLTVSECSLFAHPLTNFHLQHINLRKINFSNDEILVQLS